MSLADPQSVDIGAGAVSLPRVSVGPHNSVYMAADGAIIMTASHQYGNRTRRVIRLDVSKIDTDPIFSSQNAPYNMSTYLVVDVPKVGYDSAEALDVCQGFLTQVRAGTDTVLTKLVQGEN